MSQNRFHARQAAAALLKMAKTTSDPKVAAGLIEAAAGELPPAISVKPSDVQKEELTPTDIGTRRGLRLSGHSDSRLASAAMTPLRPHSC